MSTTKFCATQSGRFLWDANEKFSQGSYGKVYKGWDKEKNEFVAIKVLKHEDRVCSDEDLVKFDCRNVVKFIAKDEYIKSGPLWKPSMIVPKPKSVVVMEFCNGTTLEEMIKENLIYKRGLPDHLFLLVLECLSKTLQVLCQSNMVHRDISIYNVMSHTESDGEFLFKVIDFGFIKALNRDGELMTSPCGAAEFLPLELFHEWILKNNLRSTTIYKHEVDLWMVGVTLFYAATGQLPFQPWDYQNFSQSQGSVQACHRTWGEMLQQKDASHIWIHQERENGPFVFHDELPEQCNLSPALRILIQPILRNLLSKITDGVSNRERFHALFRETESVLSMNCVRLYHMPMRRFETIYLTDLSWNALTTASSCLFPGNELKRIPESMFIYQAHCLNLEESLQCAVPAYPVVHRRLCLPHQPPPTITYTVVLKESRKKYKSKKEASLLTDFVPVEEINSLEEMRFWGEKLQQLYYESLKDEEIFLLDELILAWSEKCSEETKRTLTITEQFCDSVTTMSKMCTSGASETWGKLMSASNKVLKGESGIRERLLTPKGALSSWRQPVKILPMRRQSILSLVECCNNILKKYLIDSDALDSPKGNVDKQMFLQCVNKAVEILGNIEADLKLKREWLIKVMGGVIEVLGKLEQMRECVREYDSLKKQVLLEHTKGRKNGEGDVVRCLSGLLDLMRKGESFKNELQMLEDTLEGLETGEMK